MTKTEKNKNKNVAKELFDDPYSRRVARESNVQRNFFISLVVLSIFALSFGAWFIGQQLTSPFRPKNANSEKVSAAANNNSDVLNSLRDRDTDGDTLNDYNEFYVYQTSPYLKDSDSDGISDDLEVLQATDPNCPTGQTCSAVAATNTNSATNSQTAGSSAVSADQLREILKNAGAPAEELDKMSDAELLQAYQGVLSESGVATNVNINGAADTNTSGNADQVTIEDLKRLQPAEIRQFLVESGVPQDALSLIDDATLQQIFLQSLEQNSPDTNSATGQ